MWRNGGVKYHGRTSRFVFVCLLVSLLIAISAPAQTPEAQIDLTLAGRAPRPTSGAAAWLSIPARRQAVVAFLACGQELQFLTTSATALPNVAVRVCSSTSGVSARTSGGRMRLPANVVRMRSVLRFTIVLSPEQWPPPL